MPASGHRRARTPHRTPSPWTDPAWLFLAAGIAAIASGVLIPASESLAEARYQRDVALTWEQERLDRLARHEAYLESIRNREPATLSQLRAMQLNRYPDGLEPLGQHPDDVGMVSASVFELLEPTPIARPDRPRHRTDRSRLARWATGEQSRLWLLGAGGLCVLIGLMPRAVPRDPAAEAAGESATVSA